jgi:hypothetical protein
MEADPSHTFHCYIIISLIWALWIFGVFMFVITIMNFIIAILSGTYSEMMTLKEIFMLVQKA